MSYKNPFLAMTPFWIFILLYKLGAGLHYTLMPALGERVFPIWLVGLLVGATSFFQLICDVPAGALLDRFGYLRLLKLSVFVFVLAAVVLMAGLNSTTFLITLALSAVGWLFYGPGVDAYILSRAPKQFAGRFISLRDVLDSAGIVFGMAVLSLIINWPVPLMAVAIGAALVLAFFATWFVAPDYASVHAEQKIPTQHYYIRRQYLKTIIKAVRQLNPASGLLLAAGLSASVFYGIVWFVVPVMIGRAVLGGPETIPEIGLGIFDFSVVALGFLLGHLADRLNKRRLIFFGLLLFAAAGVKLGFSFGVWFLFWGFLATAGDEMATVSLWAWLNHLDKRHAHDGVIAGTIGFFQDLGWTIGPVAGGFLFGVLGPARTIAVGTVPIALTWLVSLFILRRADSVMAVSQEVIFAKPHRRRHKS